MDGDFIEIVSIDCEKEEFKDEKDQEKGKIIWREGRGIKWGGEE